MAEKRCINLDMLAEIRELQFAVLETVLFLNTHPEDMAVLNLRNSFARDLCDLMQEYQNKYGLLRASFPGADYPWQWIDEPWPWQVKYNTR